MNIMIITMILFGIKPEQNNIKLLALLWFNKEDSCLIPTVAIWTYPYVKELLVPCNDPPSV